MNELESLLHYIDSTRHFLNNKSVNEIYKKSYWNFLNFLTRLISIQENYDAFLLSQLTNEVRATIELNDKKWLLEKLDELGKK